MLKIDKSFSFNTNDIIVVGCSAGPDSMALLHMLLVIRKKYNLSLIVAHVNHNVRVESFDEAKFMQKYCDDNNIVFETMVIEKYGDDNFHNEARNIRYHFFEEIVKKYNANYLMTAHHGDDLMETILMRIVRGSNLNGYSGFKKIVDMGTYKIVRPLILYTKLELEKYDNDNNVPYFIDQSNLKDKYTRNRYRKYILPFLKNEDNNVHLKFYKFSENISDAERFIKRSRDNAIKRVIDGKVIDIEKFKLEDSFLQKEILYYLLDSFYQDDLILLNNKHIDLIMNLIYSSKVNSFVNLPNDVVAKKSYNMLELCLVTDEITTYEIEFDDYVTLPNNHVIEKIDISDDSSNNICRLNSSDVVLPLIVRTRRVGDKIKVKGMEGTRKVKDIFIDKKVKLSERDSWPIVVDSIGKVVWIPGIKKSKFDKKKSEDCDIILKYS